MTDDELLRLAWDVECWIDSEGGLGRLFDEKYHEAVRSMRRLVNELDKRYPGVAEALECGLS